MEERIPEAPNQPLIHSHSLQQTPFTQAMAARADSPSRKGGVKSHVVPVMKPYDLEEMDEEDEGDEIVQEVEPPVDEPDALNDPTGIASGQYLLWSMDWGELDQERRNRKRPAVEDLPEEVREELACMSGADTEVRPKTQKPKLEIPESIKEPSRGRKSPADEVGVSDIATILSKPAKTAEERLAVLEARDKLIRIRSNQQRCPRLKNVGKCPDMCPEKERYQRIARHQVDYYEYNKETKEVNLGSMVKIYARSSADQQMPLPHDLRPVSVLWMTMSYLVNQFMDLADSPGENLGEWYHFLWDRMRSIRKDITQLALCDTLSVQILEMCARFHIFCMERLREEKMAVFDEKINRENLTKCLQSLQYMYNDLFLKNVSCPNEPEFQAYSILLHINSDLCTSTILGLRTEMRQHEKVQFAINAFLAVTMKNYVRFFKLVKSTTYLNACILHQYFAQVRAHAMLSIIRAYSRQKMRNTYPLPELQTQLLFDSIEDVLVFCRFSKVPVEDNNIVLEKTSHPIPMQEKMKRSFVGVECKRQTSIRDIVTGGCCLADTATLHKVHDSFDENGVLKQEAWYAEDQESSLLSVDLQEIGTLSKNTVVSSGPSSGLSEVSTVQEHVSHVPSSHFMVTQSSIQQTQKSVSSETQKNAFGSPRPVISSPHMPDMPFEMQRVHKSAESINVSEGESSARPLVQQSSESLNPDLGFSSEEQSSVKGFVFRIPDAKLEMKDNQAGQNSGIVPKAYASRTLQSIFGSVGSATSVNRSPGSSVLRNASSGHSVDTSQLTFVPNTSGHWVSPSQDAKTTVVCKQNSQNAMTLIDASNNMGMDSSQQKNSDNLFKSPDLVSSSPTSALQFPGSFGNRSGDFWGQSSTKMLPVSVQSFVKDSTPINPLAAKVSSTSSNQFPVSVHALPSPTSMEPSDAQPSVSPLIGTQAIFPNASVQFSSREAMAELAGRVAVVTGASSGIGAAITYQLLDAGVDVVALARRKDKIQAAVDQARKDAQSRGRTSIGKVASPGKLHALKCDITQEEDIVNTFKWIKDNVGVAHIVVNNAGLGDSTQLDETNTARWQRVLDTNVLGLSICTREAIQLMKAKGVDDGHIVHIGSQVGHKILSNPGIFMYSASKHAVRVLTEGLRKELVAAKSKIRVTEVSPGFVESEFVNDGVLSEKSLKQYGLKQPKDIYNLVPHLKSEDVADAVLYAVSTPSHVQILNIILGSVGENI